MSTFIQILIWVFLFVLSQFVPIGNEKSTVRRLPWITFVIIGLNVLIYYGTLPRVAEDQKAMAEVEVKLEGFIREHPETLSDDDARQKMVDMALISQSQEEQLEKEIKTYQEMGLISADAKLDDKLRKE